MFTKFFGFFKNILMSLFINPLAGAAFVMASVGGLAATGTFVGSIVVWAINIGPWWLPYVLIVGGAFMILGDLGNEGVPERFAIYLACVWPSFFLAIPKDSGARKYLTGWIDDLNVWLDKTIGDFLGAKGENSLMTVVAVTGIAVAILYCERYAEGGKFRRGGKGAAVGTTAGTTTTAAPAARRGRR